jgi:hypothetical protein
MITLHYDPESIFSFGNWAISKLSTVKMEPVSKISIFGLKNIVKSGLKIYRQNS